MNQAWVPAFIGLGSNLDEPRRQLEVGCTALHRLPHTRVHARSRAYHSKPVGPADQPDFVNAVVAVLTRLLPRDLLYELQQLEAQQGPGRDGRHWGPRRIDMDLLLYGDTVMSDQDLVLPHPHMHKRAFVLQPLAELAPTWRLPGGISVAAQLQQLNAAPLRPVEE